MASNQNNGSGHSYDATFSYAGGYSAGGAYSGAPAPAPQQLRRRTAVETETPIDPLNGAGHGRSQRPPSSAEVVRRLDFMFPRVDTEYTVRTERGGLASLIAYGLIALLVLAETVSWVNTNYRARSTVEHIAVDASLGKRMRVNLDITFPSLSCEDLHVDIMDVAGDSQLDVEDTLVKKRLNRRGMAMGKEEIVESNAHQQKQSKKVELLKEELPEDYCGPCYGAHASEGQCCNTCDELMEAYKAKRWRTEMVMQTAEQCIREGRDRPKRKRMRRGEGCNLKGYFMVNRVGGNFHIAMGEGVEREGRHIHTFNPDDTHNFNASHVIDHLSFGPEPESSGNGNAELTALNGVSKIVTKEYGTTGLFQYFIKVVPTIYKGVGPRKSDLETNRYFYTERFRPLMKEYFDDDDLMEPDDDDDDDERKEEGDRLTSVQAGHVGGHSHPNHHNVQKNSVLPGVFFIYEIYPFEVEISRTSVPLTHLLIRLMATVGGVFTITRWVDSLLSRREKRSSGRF